MSTREANLIDAASIARVHVNTWRTAYRDQLPQKLLDDLSVDVRTNSWNQILSAQETKTFVYNESSQIVGFVNVGPTRDEDKDRTSTGEILAIYIEDAHQGKGVGSTLFAVAKEHLRANHFSEYSLWVLESNTPTHRFYQRMGMKTDGVTKTARIAGVRLNEVRFVGKL